MSRRTIRPRTLAIGALVVLLAAAPFVPHGAKERGAIAPTAAETRALLRHASAGPSAVTPAARAEIDRVVAAGLAAPRLSARATPGALVAELVRCAEFDGQGYCLHTGWTESTSDEVVADATAAAAAIAARPRANSTTTGDADLLTTLRESAVLSPTTRAAAELAELTEAARAVAKVWLLRNQVEGVPLPDGFLDRHPEIRIATTSARAGIATASPTASTSASQSAKATTSPTASATASPTASPTTKQASAYPQRDAILDKTKVAEQNRTYYCGPTSMQMIAWGWKGERWSQQLWADKLGTTTSGTAITDMVRVTNSSTGWDNDKHAGPYIVLDIKDYSFYKWMLLQMRHITDYHAPVVLHPILLKQYYPYLDDDASGHYQVGRGYNQNGDKANLISYFEPWNQQRFDPSEPYIARVQWRSAYKSYRANEAHFLHNIGV